MHLGEEGFESLTVDGLTDHITRFCLAALGHGEPITGDPANSVETN